MVESMKTGANDLVPPGASIGPRSARTRALHDRSPGARSTALYTPGDLAALRLRARPRPTRAPSPTRAASTPTGYRGKLWTMRQFAGFGTPEETNERYRQLLAAGGTGLSVAFDLPTLMGRDPDHELSLGEVGKCGVSVASLADMETLFDGIPLGDDHDVDDDQLAGVDDLRDVSGRRRAAGRDWQHALGHDPERHPEGVHRAEGVHLPAARRRCGSSPTSSRSAPSEVPQWNTISVSGYHIREAGATAPQELAFTLRDGIEYVQWGDRRRARRRRLRAAHLVLLQRAQRLLRGDREVPRGAPDLGAGDARPLRREGRALAGSCGSTPRRPACR